MRVLGHEFVGDIVEAPSTANRVGERVVGKINVICGTCNSCLANRPSHCQHRSVLGIKNRNGAFAEYLCLPLENLISVPDSLSDESAVFTEPIAAALEILQQVAIRLADHVLLIGAGRLGQLIAQVLRLTGCDLQVVARYPKQQKLLEADAITAIDEAGIPDSSFDVVVEATGSIQGLDLARRAVRPRGTIVLKSTYKGDYQFNVSSLVVDEVTLIGSRCGPFRPALNLLARKLVNPTPLIDAQFPLAQALHALEKAKTPGTLKVIIHPDNIKT